VLWQIRHIFCPDKVSKQFDLPFTAFSFSLNAAGFAGQCCITPLYAWQWRVQVQLCMLVCRLDPVHLAVTPFGLDDLASDPVCEIVLSGGMFPSEIGAVIGS